ncbi:MAG: beta-ketoacyl reductase, partial [Pseudonocardiaceae bacterium]
PESLLTAVGRAYTRGAQVDWARIVPAGRMVPLPSYAFQRERYWITQVPVAQSRRDEVIDQWRYRVTWSPLAPARADVEQGRWLVVVPAGAAADLRDQVVAALGAEVLELDTTNPDRAVWSAALTTKAGVTGVVSLLAGVQATTTLVQAVLDAGLDMRVWAVTQGAVGTGADDPVLYPQQAQVWGAGRVIALEHPTLWGGLIDLPADPGPVIERGFAAVLDRDEDQVALRAEGAYGRRLVRADLGSKTGSWRARGTVLITGGTGGLGARVARWVATRGAEHVVLTSRRGEDAPGAAELREELEQLGVEVTIAACDVADRDAVAALVGSLRAGGHEIRIVVHAAGVGQFTPVAEVDGRELDEVAAAKVGGAMHLNALFGEELDAFVLFSSVSGVWGSSGQVGYGAANAFLDGLAEQRRARGLATTAVAWGPWAGEGMGASGESEEFLRRCGLKLLDPGLAIEALQQALDGDETAVAIADLDWSRFGPTFTATRVSPLLVELLEAVDEPVEDDGAAALRERIAGASEKERSRIVMDLVRENAAAVLGHTSAAQVTATGAFKDLGFDSLMAVRFRDRLNTALGVRLPSTAVFYFPKPVLLAEHILELLLPDSSSEVDTELDRLEALLGRIGDADRRSISLRLKALAAKWSEPAADDVAARIENASDDELFAFIDKQLDNS